MSALRQAMLAQSILATALLAGCAAGRTTAQPENHTDLTAQTSLANPWGGNASSPDAVGRLTWYRAQAARCSDNALANGGTIDDCRKDIGVFVEAAITASNESCATWFEELIRADVETTYTKNLVNIAGNSAQALMGLTGDSPTQIAKVALALGLVNAGFDNYRAVFLMSSTLHKVRKTIDTARKAATDVMRTNLAGYKSWDDANEDVRAFHKSCSREVIFEILDAGAGATAYVLAGQGTAEIELANANRQLYLVIFGGGGEFSEADLVKLASGADDIIGTTDIPSAGLAKTAQAKYRTQDEKGKADFRRWLALVKSHVARVQDAAAAEQERAQSSRAQTEAVSNEAQVAEQEARRAGEFEKAARVAADSILDETDKAAALAAAAQFGKLRAEYERIAKAAGDKARAAAAMNVAKQGAWSALRASGSPVPQGGATHEIRFKTQVNPTASR